MRDDDERPFISSDAQYFHPLQRLFEETSECVGKGNEEESEIASEMAQLSMFICDVLLTAWAVFLDPPSVWGGAEFSQPFHLDSSRSVGLSDIEYQRVSLIFE